MRDVGIVIVRRRCNPQQFIPAWNGRVLDGLDIDTMSINISRICLRGTESHTITDTIWLEQVANANFHDPVTVTAREREQVTPTAYLFQ
jgi:hypothetical protein